LTGFWQPAGCSQEEAAATVQRMAETLAYRGPDDAGVWVDGEAGLGYLFTAEREGHWARRLLEKALPWILRPARVIVQNPADRALLENMGVPRARLRLIPGSGVDVAAFRPVGRAPNPTPVVLMPSRMLWDKGVGEFVEAARAARARSLRARGGYGCGQPQRGASRDPAYLAAGRRDRVVGSA